MEQYIETISCEDICRLCVSQQQSINIFSDSTGPKTPKYSEIIVSLADVLITEKDELPKGICSECGLKLVEFYKFKEQIEESYNELKVLLKPDNYEHEPPYMKEDPKAANLEITQLEQQNVDAVELENILKNEVESIMDEDENDNDNYTIDDIDIGDVKEESSKSDELIFNDYENFEDINKEDGYLEDFNIYDKDYVENSDNEKIDYNESIKQIAIDGECVDDESLWKNKLDMWIKKQKQTNKLKKKPSRVYICDTCGKGWKSQSELARHNIIHTGRRFECTLCQKKFNQMSHLKGHIDAVHYNKRDFQCTVCNMAFSKKYTLTKHMRVHSDQTLYQCQYCPRSFKWQSSLEVHLNSHTGDRPFSCHLCEKSYTSDPALRKHCKRYHNGFGIKPIEQDDILVEEII